MIVKIIDSAQVVTQVFKRGITTQDIEHVLNTGVIIREYRKIRHVQVSWFWVSEHNKV